MPRQKLNRFRTSDYDRLGYPKNSVVGAYFLACELAYLAQKGASQTLARLAYFRVPSHDIA